MFHCFVLFHLIQVSLFDHVFDTLIKYSVTTSCLKNHYINELYLLGTFIISGIRFQEFNKLQLLQC